MGTFDANGAADAIRHLVVTGRSTRYRPTASAGRRHHRVIARITAALPAGRARRPLPQRRLTSKRLSIPHREASARSLQRSKPEGMPALHSTRRPRSCDMTTTRLFGAAALVAAALAVAPAALADEPVATVPPCDCSCAHSAKSHAHSEAAAERDARQARAEREENDAFLQRVWTGP